MKYALAASALVEAEKAVEKQEAAEKVENAEAAECPMSSGATSGVPPLRPSAASRNRPRAAARPRATVSAPGGSRAGQLPRAPANHNRARSAVQRSAMLQKLLESPLAPPPRPPGRWPALRTGLTRPAKGVADHPAKQPSSRLVALPSSPSPHASRHLPPLPPQGGRKRQPHAKPKAWVPAWQSGATPKVAVVF